MRIHPTARPFQHKSARRVWRFVAAALVPALLAAGLHAQPEGEVSDGAIADAFFFLATGDTTQRSTALELIESTFEPGYVAPLLEVVRVSEDPEQRLELLNLIGAKTGAGHGYDIEAWYQWLWASDPPMISYYPEVKAALYGGYDKRFLRYFHSDLPTRVRLSEIRWGGVGRDGIPPLRFPLTESGADADWLANSDVVFGVVVNGEARAYPQRILGWHELVMDRFGDTEITGVYCPLCGTMLAYHSELDGTLHRLGTSGFLYRSNKLMYDWKTSSLWNSYWGEPVVGPLANSGIKLRRIPVTTTSWSAWKAKHPNTSVVALPSRFDRDYREGMAYREYLASTGTMFGIPVRDSRLTPKHKVLGISPVGTTGTPVAIDLETLQPRQLYWMGPESDRVLVTDAASAGRVYAVEQHRFVEWNGVDTLVDADGGSWSLTEAALVGPNAERLLRVPASESFWFGWINAYPQTELLDSAQLNPADS